jgi:hypothetical protein
LLYLALDRHPAQLRMQQLPFLARIL